MAKSGASALGVDWTCSARNARYLSGGRITLQGNFDPSRLLSPPEEIKRMVTQMINEFGKELITHVYGPGDFFGFLPNLTDSRYDDSAMTTEDTVLRMIPPFIFL